jgi:hypothetical protein
MPATLAGLGRGRRACAFVTPEGPVRRRPAATLLALGGASWPRLGSDGRWQNGAADAGARARRCAVNCGFRTSACRVARPPLERHFLRERHAGAPDQAGGAGLRAARRRRAFHARASSC